MLKKILAIVAMLYAAATFAAVDVNKATAAELDGIKGIGPGISTKIIDERKKGNYKDWNDFITRVQGVGEGNAAKFSAEGLTVNGAGFSGAAAAPAKKEEKPVKGRQACCQGRREEGRCQASRRCGIHTGQGHEGRPEGRGCCQEGSRQEGQG